MVRRLICLLLGIASVAATTQPARENEIILTADHCKITVPADYEQQDPKGRTLLQAESKMRVDDKGRQYMIGVSIQRTSGGNPFKRPVAAMLNTLVERQKLRLGKSLISGPDVADADVPGADGARTITCRASGRENLEFRYVDVYVCAGTDLWIVNGYVAGESGSAALDADHPASTELRTILESFQLTPVAATQRSQ